MSNVDSVLHTDSKSLPLEIENISTQLIWTLANESLSPGRILDNRTTFNVTTNNTTKSDYFSTTRNIILHINDLNSDSTETAIPKSDSDLDSVSTTTVKIIQNTLAEVTLSKPEVLTDSGLGIAENVVIGACAVVVVLACLAILLRIVMPYVRPKLKKNYFVDKDIDSSERKIRYAYTHISFLIFTVSHL